MDDISKAIGQITVCLVIIIMLSMGMFLDEVQTGAKLFVGGWDGIRGAGKEAEEVICTEAGCN